MSASRPTSTACRRSRRLSRTSGGTGAAETWRLDHHGPHLPSRLHQGRLARWAIPLRTRCRAEGFQLLRVAAWQSRGDDPRNLRQHSPPQPARTGTEGGFTRTSARTKQSRCTRRRRTTSQRHAAGGTGWQGVRLGFLAGLGRKGTACSGSRPLIAESYERIHRSNLIGMGVLPLQFPEGEDASSLGSPARRPLTSPGSLNSTRGHARDGQGQCR